MKKKKDHDFSEIICQSQLDKGFYCSEKALCATLYSHSHTFHRHRSLPLPCSAKASFARCYRAVQWKQFLTSGAEPSYLPPLIQEKDRELQTVSIPDILFPAPKLPFPFLKKWKPQYLNQHSPHVPASQEFATRQFTKSHQEASLSFSLWRKQLWLLLELRQTSPNTTLHKTHASSLLLEMKNDFQRRWRSWCLAWLALRHFQLHPFSLRKAWQALAGNLKNLLVLWNFCEKYSYSAYWGQWIIQQYRSA